MPSVRSASVLRSAGPWPSARLPTGSSASLMGSAHLKVRRIKVRRKETLDIDCRRLSRDQGWFLSIFLWKFVLGLIAFPGKPWFGFLFLGAYAFYVWKELQSEASASGRHELEPLKVRPRDADPTLIWAALQTIA